MAPLNELKRERTRTKEFSKTNQGRTEVISVLSVHLCMRWTERVFV